MVDLPVSARQCWSTRWSSAALAWKAAQSPRVEKVFVAPGNAGTALEAELDNVDIGAEDIDALLAFARDKAIDLTIVGPEATLAEAAETIAGLIARIDEWALTPSQHSGELVELAGARVSRSFTQAECDRYGIEPCQSA